MSDDLREKMIALIREGFHDKPFTPENIADAAIALVLEEAAKVAEDWAERNVMDDTSWRDIKALIAAIRALKEASDEQ